MASDSENCKGLRVLDPVAGLLDYVLDVKPFHTKIVEVLVDYVYEEGTDVTMLEDYLIDINVLKPDIPLVQASCRGGYSHVPYGGPRGWPIISPNQAIKFEDYPAIDGANNTIIAIGDKTHDLEVGDKFEMSSFIEDIQGLCVIRDVGPNYFIIEETSVTGDNFNTVFGSYSGSVFTSGMPYDDERGYGIDTITVESPGLLRVTVHQNIQGKEPIGHLGLKREPGLHNSVYTVAAIEYKGGTNHSWPNVNDPTTYVRGEDPHTVITTVEDIDALPSFTATQNYSANMRLVPVEVTKVLSYSNIRNLPTNTPDEGVANYPIVDIVASTLDNFGIAVPDSGKVYVDGNLRISNIFVGEPLRIVDSSDNNGLYTITSMEYIDTTDRTVLGVEEKIRTDLADGTAQIDIPSNAFYLEGDHTHRFTQGVYFNIVGGTYQGEYVTMYSDYANGRTRVRPSQEIINRGTGTPIVDVLNSTTVVVLRDRTFDLRPGSNINITGTTTNDGMYPIVTSIYDSIEDVTAVVIDGELDLVVEGELFSSDLGLLKEYFFGFSAGTEFCDLNPETLLTVKFDEEFVVDGITLDLHSDVILYNMENDDWWGYDTPITTSYSIEEPLVSIGAVAPAIVELATPPTGPTTNMYWFNTSDDFLYRWTGTEWVIETVVFWFSVSEGQLYQWFRRQWLPTKTIYWLDEDTNLFYYRTMYDQQLSTTVGDTQRIDTGWVQMFATPPGYSDVQPAGGTFNAHVTEFSTNRHQKQHWGVYTTPAHSDASFTLPGGNFVFRLGPEVRLELWSHTGPNSGFLDFDATKSFEIESINTSNNEIQIDGDFVWLFSTGNVLGVRIWNETYHEMVVVGSQLSTGKTLIEVSPADIAKFQGLTTTFGTVLGAVYNPDEVCTYLATEKGASTYIETDGITYKTVEPQRIHTLAADATIKENFSVDWGSTYAWSVESYTANTVTVVGDITNFLSMTNKMFITNSIGNDGTYVIDSYALNVSGPGPTQTQTVITIDTTFPTDEPSLGHYGYVQIEDSEVIDWFQFMIVSADATSNEFVVSGDATQDIPNGGEFKVVGTPNAGTYTATVAPSYDGGMDQTTIQVANVAANSTGGWIEHV